MATARKPTIKGQTVRRFGEVAQRLVDNGYPVLPLIFGEKRPSIAADWTHYAFEPKHTRGAFSHKDDGTGILTGEIVGLDIDVRDPAVAAEIETLAETSFGKVPRRIGAAPKVLMVLRTDNPFSKITSNEVTLPGDAVGEKKHKVEVLGVGQQFVAYNQHPDTGKPYRWNGAGDPLSVPASQLPTVTEAQMREFIVQANVILAKHSKPTTDLQSEMHRDAEAQAKAVEGKGNFKATNPDECRAALQAIPNDDLEYDQYIKIGYSVAGALGADGRDDWHQWAGQSAKYDEKKTESDWQGFMRKPVRSGAGTIFREAMNAGWSKTDSNKQEPANGAFDYKAHMKSAQDLLDDPPPPIEYLIPDLFARGASVLLVGKPKSFKSTLAMQFALAMCGNKSFLSDWALFGKISQVYRVCIIDYEQKEQIAAAMLARFGTKTAGGLIRIDTFPKLDEAGIDELRKLIEEQRLDAVIIDSWTRAQPELKHGKGVFMGEGEIMQRVTKLANETDCLIIVIAHAGKRDAADDPMQMIAGTNALPASVDDVLVLFKDGEDEGSTVQRKLFVSGRNIAKHGTYVIEKRDIDACFVLKGSEDVFVRGEVRRKIMGLLGGGAAMSPNDLGKSMGRDRGQVHRALASLIAEKLVVPFGNGKYTKRSTKITQEISKKTNGGSDE
jgi:AAA domain/Primase C terminal 2 (PriCT-2)/Bifunctional DNA primase/polymerase, N-terminal